MGNQVSLYITRDVIYFDIYLSCYILYIYENEKINI